MNCDYMVNHVIKKNTFLWINVKTKINIKKQNAICSHTVSNQHLHKASLATRIWLFEMRLNGSCINSWLSMKQKQEWIWNFNLNPMRKICRHFIFILLFLPFYEVRALLMQLCNNKSVSHFCYIHFLAFQLICCLYFLCIYLNCEFSDISDIQGFSVSEGNTIKHNLKENFLLKRTLNSQWG